MESSQGGRVPNQGRDRASIALAVIGSLLAVAAVLLLYARAEIIDEDSFADNAVEALADDRVRDVATTEIVVQLVERGSADLIAARPLVEQVVATVVDTAPFRQIFREAARQANRLLFVEGKENVAFNISDGLEIVRFALNSINPQIADEIPKDLDLKLAKLKEREFATQTLVVADRVRLLGVVAPILAALVLIASVALARDRRVGVLRAAVAVAGAGALVAILYLIVRARVLAGVIGEDEVTDEELRGAFAGIIDAFLGGLFVWGIALTLIGVVVGGAAAALDPERTEDPARRLWDRVTARPASTPWRVLRAVLAIALGLVVALEPITALAIVGLLAGAWLVYFGVGELLGMLQPPETAGDTEAESGRRRTLLRAGLGAAAVIAAAVIAVLVISSGPGPRDRERTPSAGCNGSPELCDLRLNEVAFAGTHNSFSAADTPGWFITNQRHDISRQLEDGIRLFLIDPHWGIKDPEGVRTDFEAEGRDRNRVAAALPPKVLAAAERLAGSLGVRGTGGGEADVWLCHTVCELGATKMSTALGEIKTFLDENPGEVVILFVEPYVPPEEIEREFQDAGLADRTAPLERGSPLPTLGELVRTDKRLVVLTEKDADGSIPWYLDGFSFVQDTPLGATEVDQLSCDRNRGEPDSPLLMLNHWADLFPPRRSANEDFQTREELLARARECARKRGMPVNMIAVDHYDLGALVEVVDELNSERAAGTGRR